MIANGTTPSQYYMGVTSEAISNNADGKVYQFGKMRGVNTSAFTDGDILYVSTTVAGGFQTTQPTAPNNIIVAAAVVHAANNGTLMIRQTLGSNINADEGVLITTPVNNNVLTYESSTSLWKNKTVETALGFTPVPTTRTLTINGTTQDLSADRTFTIATGLTVGTTPITSGTVGRVLFEGTGNVLQESANLFWDNTNGFLGIKRTNPAVEIDVIGSIRASSIIFTSIAQLNFIQTNGQNLTVRGASSVSYMTMFQSTGNLLLQNGGTFTDAGFRLDVNGTARVSGSLTVGSGSLSNSSLLISRNITGSTNVSSVLNTSTIQSDVTFAGTGFSSQIGTQNTTFTLTLLRHFAAFQGAIGAGSIVSNQYGFHASSGLISAQNNFGFRGEIPAGATNWNLYMNGSANNYLAGNLLIGTTTDVASSILTLGSTTKGFLPPRMTTTQKNAIATPATGLMVYDTTLNLISVYNGTTWITL
jgi:hypothetical protein